MHVRRPPDTWCDKGLLVWRCIAKRRTNQRQSLTLQYGPQVRSSARHRQSPASALEPGSTLGHGSYLCSRYVPRAAIDSRSRWRLRRRQASDWWLIPRSLLRVRVTSCRSGVVHVSRITISPSHAPSCKCRSCVALRQSEQPMLVTCTVLLLANEHGPV